MKLAVVSLLALASPALAEDFTVAWHQVTVDEKGTTTADETWVVRGAKITYDFKYDGPQPDKPSNKPRKAEGKVVDAKALAAALAALDKVKVTPESKGDPKQTDYTACITRKKKKRCEFTRGNDKVEKSPGMAQMTAITELLVEGVPPSPK
jgi:hypothetical protein